MPIMYDPPMPCPRLDFSPSQWIHPKWSGLEQIISISPPKTRHRIPTRGIVGQCFFSVWAASTAHNSAAVSLHKHPSANILVRGHRSISDSAASLSLPSPLDLEPPSSLPMPPRTESISRQRSYLRAAMEKFDKKMSSIFFF